MRQVAVKARDRRAEMLKEFEASGKNSKEFARMKGITPARLSQILKRARADREVTETVVVGTP